MTFVLAILAAFGAFLGSWLVLSVMLGVVANFGQFFHLLIFVPPYRTITRALAVLAPEMTALEAFGAVIAHV